MYVSFYTTGPSVDPAGWEGSGPGDARISFTTPLESQLNGQVSVLSPTVLSGKTLSGKISCPRKNLLDENHPEPFFPLYLSR